AALRLLLLPGLGDIDDMVLLQLDAAERRLRELRLELLWRVGVDPLAGLCAERGLLRGVIEIHGGPLMFAIRTSISLLVVRRRRCAVSNHEASHPSRRRVSRLLRMRLSVSSASLGRNLVERKILV